MMKKVFIFVLGILFLNLTGHSQSGVRKWIEDFDGSTVSYAQNPQGSWVFNTDYYLPSLSGSSVSKSYLGFVPSREGDTIILQTASAYDLSNYDYVQLRFSHICKVSPMDIAKIQYRIAGQRFWEDIDPADYKGGASNYTKARGFNAASYPEWQARDSTVIPMQSWWKEEFFDLTVNIKKMSGVEIRFLIIHGDVPHTQASFGWLLENIQLTASTHELSPPIVKFIPPSVKNTVYTTGPHEINAKVKTTTNAPIKHPWLKYTATEPGKPAVTDSISMTKIAGDSLWKATIPQYIAGTKVEYSITGRDTIGNEAIDMSGYVIVRPSGGDKTGYVIVGTGTTTTSTYYFPVGQYYGTSWSRQIYLASELNSTSAGGIITEFAWDYASSGTFSKTNQYCYFQVVDDVATVSGYTDPVANGATLVWSGTFSASGGRTWINLQLDQPFYLPPGKNLMVYWINNNGTSYTSTTLFNGTSTSPTNRTIYAGAFSTVFPSTSTGTLTTNRPNARFYIIGTPPLNYSAGTFSIDMSDTIIVSPGLSVPIVATIKNKGKSNLDSVTVSYSINNAAHVSKKLYFNPGLPWDHNYQDTLGYYVPGAAINNAITVWISSPNGVHDSTTWDDTLTKNVYGSSDLLVAFVSPPANTVYTTGPYGIKASIKSITGAALPVTISLHVDYTYQGVTTSDVLPMLLDASDNLWKATIPQKRFNNHVEYSISLIDIVGNTVVLSNSYDIKRLCEGTSKGCDTNSVGLVSIDSPEKTGVLAGYDKPVRVTLKNKGVADLDSCYLNWSLNGVQQPGTAVYRGPLPDDFTDTITVGSYMPVANQRDTIKVWVSMPNGKVDPVKTDDTLTVSPLGCGTILSGYHQIGEGRTYTKLTDVLNIIRNCGVSGNLILQLKGEHPGADLNGISNYLQGYTLTITSYDNDPDSARIKVTSGAGITLNNSNNIVIKSITVDATKASYAIQFTGTCTNVVIRDCKLLTDTASTATTVAPIYKASATGVVDSIFIIHNLLDGGYDGFSFYGAPSTSVYGTNVIFDSNIVRNQSHYACAPQHVDFISYSHNTILSRTANIATAWHGLRAVYCNGPIIGNRIHQRNTGITSPDGILIQYYNQYPASKLHQRTLVANNEVITSPTGGISALHFTSAKAECINNSLHVSGSGNAYGIYIVNSTMNDLAIKNNNIVMTSATARPIEFSGTGNLQLYDIDYNNLYAPTNIGFYGVLITSMQTWQQTIPTDRHSKNIMPVFVDPSMKTSLEIVKDLRFLCNVIPPVITDIRGNIRAVTTTMGCYDVGSYQANATLWEITGLTDGHTPGQTEDVNVVVFNTGEDDITSINLEWSVNGTSKGSANHPVSLSRGDSTTIMVGQLTYPSANVTVKVWINNLNNDPQLDEYAGDDTVSRFVNVCNGGGYSGVVKVGKSVGAFPSFEAAYQALTLCGVLSNITIEIEPGTYPDNLSISNNATAFGTHKLTVTSSTSNASDVIVNSTIRIENATNVTFKNITVDVDSVSNACGIVFAGTCSNIEINACTILADPTTTSSTVHGIWYNNTNGSGNQISNISIINNTIDGGYCNVYFNYLGGAVGQGLNNIIDNNIFLRACSSVYIIQYGHVRSVSNNTIITRNTSTQQYGIHFRTNTCVDTIANNKILMQGTGTCYALDLYEQINSTTNGATHPVLLVNNEIRHLALSGGTYGILMYQTRADILHNSVYFKGTSSAYAMYINNTRTTDYLNIKNNIFSVETSGAGYPLYVNTATHVTQAFNTFMDYNDYHNTGANFAYLGGTTITTLPALQTATGQDANSVSVKPLYIDTAVSLECSSYDDKMECPLPNGVTTDIEGTTRLLITTMGAYTDQPVGLDLRAQAITPWNTKVVKDQVVQVNLNVASGGTTPVSSATFGWSLNGQTQQTGIPWNPAQPLGLAQQANVTIGSFTVTNTTNTYNIVVWIERANGQQDMKQKNDTVRTSATLVPLAEWVKPFNGDTISILSFDVPAIIYTSTGAPQTPPELIVVTTIGTSVFQNTAPMTLSNGVWTANVPQQYYGSKVVYSLNVSDTKSNSISLKDSVYIISGVGTELYTGHDLAVFSLVSPVTNPDDLCVPNYLPVQVPILNLGEDDYDFTQDSIKVCAEIIDPKGFIHSIIHTVKTGTLESGHTDTVEIMSALPVYAGLYKIKTWVSSSVDHIIYDDTLITTYASPKIGLPLYTNFSTGIPIEFVSSPRNGNSVWEHYYDPGSTVQPDSGTAMIRFNGTPGSIARLSTGQLDLFQAFNPFVEFWYYHDATTSTSDYTNTEINVLVNDVRHNIGTIYLKDSSGRHGWTHYKYDLSAFTTVNACILIQFESINKYSGSAQHIDYIGISSEPDAAVSGIIITPAPDLCHRSNKNISVVLTATRSQAIHFDNASALILDMNGIIHTVSLQGIVLDGNSSDTVPVLSNITIPVGITDMKAYFNTPVDNIHANDTADLSLDIRPAMSLTAQSISGGTNCLAKGGPAQQEVKIKNMGNIEIPGIELVLNVMTSPQQTLTKSVGNLAPGDSAIILFDAYTVPAEAQYQVQIAGYMSCDSVLVNASTPVTECVDMDDLVLVETLSPDPLDGGIDQVGSTKEIEVSLTNTSDMKNYQNVDVTTLIENASGQILARHVDIIPAVNVSESNKPFKFTDKYTVPNEGVYYVRVFISKVDNYQENDTILITRTTSNNLQGTGNNVFAMEQNIPNPANTGTTIRYHIPEPGEVVFHVHSISGKLLYTKVLQAEPGKHTINVNTSSFAAGIYIYSMEFNGQRIVKRMSIKR